MFERFTEAARRSLFFARYKVADYGGRIIEPEHMLLGLLHRPDILQPLRFTPVALNSMEEALIANVSRHERTPTQVEIPFSEPAKAALKRAEAEADDGGSHEIRPIHLLLGILVTTEGAGFRALNDAGVTAGELRSLLASPSAE
jgi:ATP-dependent Clp protease ATP-binding subunit ClpC